MATYLELFGLRSDDPLRNKVIVATSVKAEEYLTLPTPTQAQIDWANDALANPNQTGIELFSFVLAANKDQDVATIQGSTDAQIQNNVDTAVDAIVAGGT